MGEEKGESEIDFDNMETERDVVLSLGEITIIRNALEYHFINDTDQCANAKMATGNALNLINNQRNLFFSDTQNTRIR